MFATLVVAFWGILIRVLGLRVCGSRIWRYRIQEIRVCHGGWLSKQMFHLTSLHSLTDIYIYIYIFSPKWNLRHHKHGICVSWTFFGDQLILEG